MANKKNCFGILVIMLVFGMMVTSCGNNGGSLTITNIPSKFNENFVIAEGGNRSVNVIGAQSVNASDMTLSGARISNGKVVIPLWQELEEDTFEKYTDNDILEFEIYILESPSDDSEMKAKIEFGSITFSKGKATVSFQDANRLREDF